jgi:hypothetical protein
MKTGDRPDGWRAELEDGGARPELSPAAAVNSRAAWAQATYRTEDFRGERVMTDQPRPVLPRREPALVRSCWMCGIRLPADQMVADGGSACPDLRWYCRDTAGCTERWTAHAARRAATGRGTADPPDIPGEQATGADAAQAVPA